MAKPIVKMHKNLTKEHLAILPNINALDRVNPSDPPYDFPNDYDLADRRMIHKLNRGQNLNNFREFSYYDDVILFLLKDVFTINKQL